MQFKLKKPLAFFDLETTGTNVSQDRIVELSVLKFLPDGTTEEKTRRINPEMPIPIESSLVHGIYDEDVVDEPTFKSIAKSLFDFLQDCDLAGFNSNKFDVPVLVEEFHRAGIDFDVTKRNLVDVQNIFHKMEQRTLVAGYKFYCNKDLTDAHSAAADTKATAEILEAMLTRYQNTEFTDKDGSTSIPVVNDMTKLADFSRHNNNADLIGRFVYDDNNEVLFNFGKHKGKKVADVLNEEPSYYAWMMNGDFPRSTKTVLENEKMKLLKQKFEE
jgi:DNA polymerase-3 subunit epsilon